MRPVTPGEQIKSCISLIPESDRKRGISTYRKTFGNIFHIQQEKTFPFTIHNSNSRIPSRETIYIRETQLGIFAAFLQQQFTLNIIHAKQIFPRINKLILPVTINIFLVEYSTTDLFLSLDSLDTAPEINLYDLPVNIRESDLHLTVLPRQVQRRITG